jgi:hypothetical protein
MTPPPLWHAGLRHYAAASLLLAAMFACLSTALVSVLEGPHVLLAVSGLVGATLLSQAATKEVLRARVYVEHTVLPHVTADSASWRRALFVHTIAFFVLTALSASGATLLLLYGVPALRPPADFPTAPLVLSISVSYSIFVSAFFFGAVSSASGSSHGS